MFQIIGAMAEFERALIQERVKAGMRNARAKGRRIGRPPQTPLSSDLRTVIANTYACGGTSLRALAKKFGTFLATVQRCVWGVSKGSELRRAIFLILQSLVEHKTAVSKEVV